ncbi:hypothetical protein MRX96_051208 [Rhipicephalus microplus]
MADKTRRTDRTVDLRERSQHACHVCAAHFSSAWDLQVHYATHRHEEPHHCREGGTLQQLEAPSVCRGCHLTFPRRSLLLQHRCTAVVSPRPVYVCPVCGLRCEHRDTLNTHIDCEHYQCLMCSHAFEHSFGLVAHLVRHALELT